MYNIQSAPSRRVESFTVGSDVTWRDFHTSTVADGNLHSYIIYYKNTLEILLEYKRYKYVM